MLKHPPLVKTRQLSPIQIYPTVDAWLKTLSFGNYTSQVRSFVCTTNFSSPRFSLILPPTQVYELFHEEVWDDWETLGAVNDELLKELGIKSGIRHKILTAISKLHFV